MHSPEPWTVDEAGEILDASGTLVVEPIGLPSKLNTERIVACVNLLAGIPTEAIIQETDNQHTRQGIADLILYGAAIVHEDRCREETL